MRSFLLWLEEQEKASIPGFAIKIGLPSVRQQSGYSCGAAVLRAVCGYFDVGPKTEDEFIELLKSNEKDGTWPENIVKEAKKLGLEVKHKTNMTLAELITYLRKGMPVICAMQAWGDEEQYKNLQSGHYVCAIGYDDKNLYFEDPSLDGGKRGFLPFKEFLKRWHDIDAHGCDCYRLGIALWKSGAKPVTKKNKAELVEWLY